MVDDHDTGDEPARQLEITLHPDANTGALLLLVKGSGKDAATAIQVRPGMDLAERLADKTLPAAAREAMEQVELAVEDLLERLAGSAVDRARFMLGGWQADFSGKDPQPGVFAAIRGLLEKEAQDDPTAREVLDNNTLVDHFARELHREATVLLDKLGKAGFPPRNEDEAIRATDGVLWADEILARHLETLGTDGVAEQVREKARERWRAYSAQDAGDETRPGSGNLWRGWYDLHEKLGRYPYPFLFFVAGALWLGRLREELGARPLSAQVVVVGDDHQEGDPDRYARILKPLAPISWAMGGTGNVLEIDGTQYAAQPANPRVDCVVPRSWEVVRHEAGAAKPGQSFLPLQMPGVDPLPLALVSQTGSVAMARRSGAVLSPHAGKIALLLLASAPRPDAMVTAELVDIARAINPDADRIQRSHLVSTARGLLDIESAVVVSPDDWTRIRCFDMRVPVDPDNPKRSQRIEWKLGGLFVSEMRLKSLPSGRRDSYAGYFVINLDGAMRLPVARDAMLRHYIRAAAVWNDSHGIGKGRGFEASRMQWFTMNRWLALANALSARAADAMAGTRTVSSARQGQYLDRQRGKKDLDALHDRRLIRMEVRGRSGEIRPMPPEDLLEAWQAFRDGKAIRRKL
ncbi:MAG: hypothetical protein KKI08_16525 [Armatimonadetes bacterium]|nr:hypothetical protein [Armatimonadota bacterium]